MIPYTVQIISGDGRIIKEQVMAPSTKSALLKSLEITPEDHWLWNAPGLEIQVWPSREAFLIKTKGGVS